MLRVKSKGAAYLYVFTACNFGSHTQRVRFIPKLKATRMGRQMPCAGFAVSVRYFAALFTKRWLSLSELRCVLRVSRFALGAKAPASNSRLLLMKVSMRMRPFSRSLVGQCQPGAFRLAQHKAHVEHCTVNKSVKSPHV